MESVKTRWQHKTRDWLDERIPARTRHTLNLRSIFILPSKFGWGYLMMNVCLFLLGTNYQNNLMLLLCYFLLALLLVCLFKSHVNFARLTLKVDPIQPVFAGNNAVLSIQIQVSKARLSDPAPQARPHGQVHFRWWQEHALFTADLDNQVWAIKLPYVTRKRGVYALPRVTCQSEYPLGLFRCWTHLDFDQRLVVYPTPVACSLRLEQASEESGDNATEQPGHDDYYALRPYMAGEPLHRVAWKNVAKGGDWVSKAFSQQQSASGYLKLNLASRDIETELGKLAFQVLRFSEQKVQFGLQLGPLNIAPASGERHKSQCLLALARYGTVGQAK